MKPRHAFSALFVLGAIYAYRNRFRIQETLESYGINVPLFQGSLGEELQSGVAKISGKVQRVGRDMNNELNRETRRAV